ncbi:hypothetical protein HK098_003114 [Nowakowskiella sp. JEL0407]|nr:hypothetical protein HK098_003114 [Nowakowskiella sp. JEL0407]
MAWRCSGKTNLELVHNLANAGIITKKRVEEVMKQIDRGKYAPHRPYNDSPQPIGFNATISAPHMHAHALELLEDKLLPGNRALDVGSGSGYLLACFAQMVGPQGKAVGMESPSTIDTTNLNIILGIEHIPELLELSKKNIASDHPEFLSDGWVDLVVGDGRNGFAKDAPYDAIHVGAAANPVPQALLDQLAPGGRMIIPVGPEMSEQVLYSYDKDQEGRVHKRKLMGVIYVPLTDYERQDINSILNLIPEHEQTRVQKFRFHDDKLRCLSGQLLIRNAMSQLTGLPWKNIEISRSKTGKPYLNSNDHNVVFNISHHGLYAIIAFSQSVTSIGVDITRFEVPKQPLHEFYAAFNTVFTASEWTRINSVGESQDSLSRLQAFFMYWCAKEAYVKYLGEGLGAELLKIEIEIQFEEFEKGGYLRLDENATIRFKGEKIDCVLYRGVMDQDHYVVVVAEKTQASILDYEIVMLSVQELVAEQI